MPQHVPAFEAWVAITVASNSIPQHRGQHDGSFFTFPGIPASFVELSTTAQQQKYKKMNQKIIANGANASLIII